MPESQDTDKTTDQVPDDETPAKRPKYDWNDPNVLAGNSPPMPRWPLVVSVLAWCGWLVFLVIMMVMRMQTTSN